MSTARLAFRLLCLAVFMLALVEVIWMNRASSAESAEGGAAPATATDTATATATATAHPEGTAIEVLTKELEEKRASLETRAHELDEREARMKDHEKELDKKLKDLEQLRAVVSGDLDEQRKSSEDRVKKLVTVFETMTPKSSASVFETLDDWLAVEVLKRMDTVKVAKVMNIMDKTRSARLSEMLTGYFHPESDRKISSVKSAGGQAVASAPNGVKAPAPLQTAPVSPPSPQNPTKKGGEQ